VALAVRIAVAVAVSKMVVLGVAVTLPLVALALEVAGEPGKKHAVPFICLMSQLELKLGSSTNCTVKSPSMPVVLFTFDGDENGIVAQLRHGEDWFVANALNSSAAMRIQVLCTLALPGKFSRNAQKGI